MSQAENQTTMEMFLKRSIQSISKEATTKRLAGLRESCSTTLELIQKYGVTPKPNDKEHLEQVDKVLNKLVITLKLACESRQASTISSALDSLQKLMAYGYIRTTTKDSVNPDRKLMDKVIEVIGDCFDFNDDNVQIQIIKAFLTAVSSPVCQIHERALLNAIRACFNIFLASRSPVIQMTAKATLSQMLSLLFQRFEIISKKVKNEQSPNQKSKESKNEAPESEETSIDENKSTETSAKEESKKEPIENGKEKQAEHQLKGSMNIDPELREELSIAYVDCFLSFRALCKLSMKELSPNSPIDSVDMRRKLLALELIQNILENAGPMLRANEQFISTVIKKYLFISLLVNGVSPFIKIFRVSLNVFNSLIVCFKDHLKNEIGVFFAKILLRILGSSHSSVQHKHCVLLLLQKVCREAQTLVDMFLNYDCNMESVDIFERMVNELSSIAKGLRANETMGLPNQHASTIRILALDCLVTIMRSLVQWSSELIDEEKTEEPGGQTLEEKADLHDIPSNSPVLDSFTEQKQRKHEVLKGKRIFNNKPKRGIAYLIEVGHLQKTPEDVASFLLNSEGLDLTQIGRYLGEISDPFCKSVLYAYVDLQRFENMEIYTALRRFLLGFRLPGEGQQIDVIMEKFAERYFNDNNKKMKEGTEDATDDSDFLFANADAVYIFAYHMIMLATDLHHPSVKKKLTKAEWVKNNRGLNDSKDFPKEFLLKIYDTVLVNPLKTRDDPPSGGPSEELLTPKQRQILFLKETKSIVQRSQEVIQDKLNDRSTFFKSSNIEHVKPMFSMCWCPMLAAFSMNLEISQDHEKDVYSLCLEGFRCAVRVSSIFYMETERNAFITSLSQFTLLSNLREMKLKNIDAIKCLINIAHEDGNYLQGSWTQVLNCISQLAKIQILGSSMRHNEHIPASTPAPKSLSDAKLSTIPQTLNSLPHDGQSFEGLNASAVVDHIDLSEIDRIFSNTVNLNDNAIVEFVRCLCDTSLIEVSTTRNTVPRTFSLQKLIEVAYYNMERIRFVWTRIWGIMADHFKLVGCHSNLKVAMYAVDSLRQLAMKFLEKDELANYHFQKDFLKPFEHIVVNNKSLQIRELVVSCLSQMILARAENIRSGWKSIFMVFTFVAPGSEQSIVFLAYLMQDKIIMEYFPLVASSFFVECVECLTAFASNRHFKEVGIKAVESIGFCAKQLVEGNVLPKLRVVDESTGNLSLFTIDEDHLKYWLPILHGLSDVVSHPHIDVRTSSLDRLFNILLKYGNSIDANLWALVFRQVLLSIFSDVLNTTEKAQGQLQETEEWVTTTCLGAISHMVELFSFYFDLIQFLAEEFFALLTSFVLQENVNLASIGSTCLFQLISSNSEKWSEDQWKIIATTLQYIINKKLSVELLSIGKPKRNGDGDVVNENEEEIQENEPTNGLDSFIEMLKVATPSKHRPLDVKVVVGKCNVSLLLLKTLHDITNSSYDSLTNEHFDIFLDVLEGCFNFAKTLNNKANVWKATGKSEIMSLIVRLESSSCDTYLDILFRLYADSDEKRQDFARERLLERIILLSKEYMVNDNVSKYPALYSAAKIPLILKAISGYSAFTDEQFTKHLPEVYDCFCDLMLVTEPRVREKVLSIISRVGTVHSFVPMPQ